MTKSKIILIVIILLAFGALAWLGAIYVKDQEVKKIDSFEACAAAGYPVLESYPEQCKTPDGRSFTKELPSDEENIIMSPEPEESCKNQCGDNVCDEVVCLAIGCPCAESKETCPQDCASQASSTPPVGIANPASVYCVQQGGQSDIRTGADGSQVGFCVFDDKTECEEWAFFRGECSRGGN